ncbi:TWiK family of potassium channels protein 18-like isoform X2 [Pomacea canaliculata]|nr:TWiK family of potassium channels protein 18-like isoform X2 [Pomacea canaliculata]XP_025093567.1 TWiK family of potassium channels protein 18-like isoform X2 [Pomacea canaliculata]
MEPDARCTFVSDEADVTRATTTTTTSTGKLKSCCTRLVSLVRSIGGLIVLLLAYTFIGAWIMMELESPTEKQHIAEVVSNRGDTVELVKNITWNLHAGVINDSQWEDQVKHALHSFEEAVFKSGVTSTTSHKWTFFGSVLFCVTTYTTIGYGNIAPVTKWGRVATMVYATIGIPLALIVLAELGRHFMRGTKFMWAFVRRYYYTGYCRKVRQRRRGSYNMAEGLKDEDLANDKGNSKIAEKKGHAISGPGTDVSERRNGSAHDIEAGIQRERIPHGKGELFGLDEDQEEESSESVHGQNDKKVLHLSAAEVKIQSINNLDESRDRCEDENDEDNDVFDGNIAGKWASRQREEGRDNRRSVSIEPAPRSHEPSVSTSDRRSVVTIESAEEEFHLPVVIAIIFIFVYIFLGAYMYTLWEDWSFFESFYFVFITVSTIGYGDILPKHPNFFLLSCIYTFLGLALVSMTINVIMEFMTKTIETAKEKVDQAREKALATAKAAKGKIRNAGTKARNKMAKTISKKGSLRYEHKEDANVSKEATEKHS